MDDSMRKAVANQGMGYIFHTVRCSECYFIPQSMDEDDPETPYPKCRKVDTLGELGPNSYSTVANWVGQYAVSKNRRVFSVSMSGKGNCYDNAVVESFFASLKRERTHSKRYVSREEAYRDVFDYIEVFYNRKRRHSSIGGISPMHSRNDSNVLN